MGNLKKNISTILSELSEQTTGLTCKLIKMTSHKMLRKKNPKYLSNTYASVYLNKWFIITQILALTTSVWRGKNNLLLIKAMPMFLLVF